MPIVTDALTLSRADLKFNVADLIGSDFDARRTKVGIETNIDPTPIVDTAGHVLHFGDATAPVGADGSGVFTGLITTDSTDINAPGFRYRVWVDYAKRGGGRAVWRSEWFPLTADTDLALVVGGPLTPPEIADVDTTMAAELGDAGSLSSAAVRTTMTAAVGSGPVRTALDALYPHKGDLVLHVADYGAVGDGTTDDTAALQAALTAARAVGARVQFGYGKTYIVSATLNPLGVHLDGFGATIKLKAGITANFNLFQSAGAFTATDLTIDLNKANTTDPGVDTQGMAFYVTNGTGWTGRVILRDLAITNGYQSAIRFNASPPDTDSANSPLGRSVVDTVYIADCRRGIMVSNLADVTVRDCRIVSVTEHGIWAFNPNRLMLRGNTILNPGGRGISTEQALDSRITDNVVRGCGEYGISLGGGSTTVNQMRRNTVSGNVVEGCVGVGIILDPTKVDSGAAVFPSYCTVTANACNNNGGHGIYLNNAQYVAITGNMCRNNAGSGLAISAADTSIDGNNCSGNNRGIALYGNATFPNYGRHRIGVNYVAGNTASGYYVESASVTDVSWASLTTTNPAP